MKRFLVMLANMLAIATFALVSVACSDDEKNTTVAEVTSVTVTPATLAIQVGEKRTLTATVEPENAANKTVMWSSNNSTVAEVISSTGEVSAKAIGEATITAIGANGKTATCLVTVSAVEVTGVTVSPATLDLNVGDILTLTATVVPENATVKTVTWSSNAPDTVEVDASTGEVTAKAVGEATITATTANNKTATCVVTVSAVEVADITVTPATLELNVNDKQTLTVVFVPENATDKTVIWSSNDSNIAEVDVSTGEVTAKAAGTATITATTANNKTATCVVTVSAVEVADITVTPATLQLFQGYKHTLTVVFVPENASDKTVTWSSNDPNIAEVDVSTGEVTAKAGGNATITATTANGKTATCAVSVKPLLSKSGWRLGTYILFTAGSMNIANGNYNDYWDGSVVGQTSVGIPYNITLIDMRSSQTISRIDIHRGQNARRVQWSVRSSISVTVDDWKPLGGDGEYQDNDYENNKVLSIDANAGGSVSGRYLMILVATAFGDDTFRIAEIDVYGN
jgi:uncharacterized protein YjdB